MDLQQIRIKGKGDNSHDTCNVLLSFECVDNTDPVEYHEETLVLHRVQLEPTVNSTLLIDVSLDDSEVREHFESLLSANYHGFEVVTAVAS